MERRNLIGTRIAELRQKLGLTQQELACKLQENGYPFAYIDIVLLEGDQSSVTDLELLQLKKFFGTTYDYLIEGKK